MNEILIKFENQIDFEEFVKEIVLYAVNEGKAEYDAENRIMNILKRNTENGL